MKTTLGAMAVVLLFVGGWVVGEAHGDVPRLTAGLLVAAIGAYIAGRYSR